MPTTADYLEQLGRDKAALADNLVTKGVDATPNETFTTLVPKVLDIEGGGEDIGAPSEMVYNPILTCLSSNASTYKTNNFWPFMMKKLTLTGTLSSSIQRFDNSGTSVYTDSSSLILRDRYTTSSTGWINNVASVEELEFIDFNFNNVTSLLYAFSSATTAAAQSSKLKKITFKRVVAPKLTDIRSPFNRMTSLETIIIEDCNFNTALTNSTFSNLQTIKHIEIKGPHINTPANLFENKPVCEYIDASGIVVDSNKSVASMFTGCTSLKYIDISGIDFTKITTSSYTNDMFKNVPTDCTILVKDTASAILIKNKFPAYTFTVKGA